MRIFGPDNPNVMLIGHSRNFYNGLLGNSQRLRQLGAFLLYAAPTGSFRISLDGQNWTERTIVGLPAYTPHYLSAAENLITTICIEPETVSDEQLIALEHRINHTPDGEMLRKRVQDAKVWLQAGGDPSLFSAADFDELFLGNALGSRVVDDRIAQALNQFRAKDDDINLCAESCAQSVDLSMSRFLHLFKEETGLRFRSYRMWKRARKFLDHVNKDCNLTYLALDLGYPDSTHFSHSIRKIYGLKPRSVLEGSRNMTIFTGQDYVRMRMAG